MELEPLYQPQGVEERWQERWEDERLYHADPAAPGEKYAIAVPPPNVTGALHMGHALNGTIQDALARWHRMRGFNVLWQPGYDHAGISTQAVVERELRKQGTSRQDLGRDAFVERVWEWLREYGGVIMGQFRRLGCSLDYERIRFTMDDDYIRAVMRFFVHLYERGFMYRDNRIVNWCTDCRTTISDLEVEHIEIDDALTHARYPLVDGDGYVTIATVRPATILADVAVAVHPDDERYTALVGKHVLVPVVDREVPIIADERVEPAFGTGALKITPGHDPIDFEIGRDHGLPELTVIGLDGRMTGEIPDAFRGLTEDEAADAVVQWLKDHDRLEKRESYRHAVGHCDRSGTRVQPLVMLQWWCAMDELARPAIEAIDSGRVTFHPPVHGRVASDWLKAIRPWNVSRQLWWGHQLPIWYCADGHVTCAETEPAACAECGSEELARDEDVLDTWFSSALWPFATLGWPDETPELARFYPGDVDSTARDIIFLWVNRMIMSGLELMGDIPFHDVIIHSTILDPDGRRMSKSKGTGIDPIDLIDAHGADATRYGLLKMSSTQDVRFTPVPIEEGRRLANKLWNASRLLLGSGGTEVDARPASLEERWILARIDATRAEVEKDLAEYDFAHAVDRLYHLTFDDFCDWYLESIKPRLAADADVRATAFAALERLLKLLHPVMPHVTEEIWSHLPARPGRLIVAPWPGPDPAHAADAGALAPVQEAAERFRRSGVVTPLEGDLQRIFAAVVRPERSGGGGGGGETSTPRSPVSRRRSRAPRGCSRTTASRRGRRRTWSTPSGRSSSGTVASLTRSATDWLAALSPWPADGFGTGRMRALLSKLDDPQLRYDAIHVVGTNGKSTTTRMTEALLADAGLRVGAYLSPHIRSWAERIRVDGEEAGFEAALARVRSQAEALGATQFETLTAAALQAFADAEVDAAVVEAGLGGRHDATNVLRTRVVVLTNVALDHMDVLGGTREEIAAEKLAVVQPGATAVLGEPEWEALARENGAAEVVVTGSSNLALAAAAAEAFLGRPVDPHAADGVSLPGRLEHRAERPLEIWDGAHNLAGVGYLLPRLPVRRWVVLCSILEDKRPELMLRALSALGDTLVATASSNGRALPAGDLAARAKPYFRHVEPIPDPVEARARALALAGPDGALVVTGSLYLLSELSGSRDNP